MPGPTNKGYKRSWKNLLLNKRYQLRFTLFMVGLSAVLMGFLGWWVMKEANDATTVAKNSIVGDACPKIPVLTDTPDSDDSAVPMKLDDGAAAPAPDPAAAPPAPAPPGSGAAGSGAAGSGANDPSMGQTPPPGSAPKIQPSSVDPKDVAKHNAMDDVLAVQRMWCIDVPCKPGHAEPLELAIKDPKKCDAFVKKELADPAAVEVLKKALIPVVKCEGGQSYTVADAAVPEHHVKVQLEESSMTMTPAAVPPIPADYADRVVGHWTCELRQVGKIDDLERGRLRILWVLIATGLGLIVGLAIYGIKMTHKVAGPIFKISLYLAKMKDGRFDKVYNLRKGDQLVDFYDHFKTAHAGVVQLEKDDIAQIQALIAAAETAGAGEHESVAELKALLKRKEKSLE
jgi:hypothetical protein